MSKISFWLVPTAADRALFQTIINQLAQTYDAPRFTPHVTLYSGECATENIPALIEQATQDVQSLCLKIDQLLYSAEFTKTLFVQFHPDPRLSQLSETIRMKVSQPSDYVLNPHLSLIYGQMSQETQQQLISKLRIPQSQVCFDQIRAIATPKLVRTRQDVESWQEVWTRKL